MLAASMLGILRVGGRSSDHLWGQGWRIEVLVLGLLQIRFTRERRENRGRWLDIQRPGKLQLIVNDTDAVSATMDVPYKANVARLCASVGVVPLSYLSWWSAGSW